MYKTLSSFNISCFRNRVLVWTLLAILLYSFVPSISLAQQPTATINTLSGTVRVNGQETGKGAMLSTGDVIETQAGSSIVLKLSDGSLLELGENTKLDLAVLSQTTTGARVSQVKLLWGRIRAALSPGHQTAGSTFDISTPNALVDVKFSQPDVEVSYDPAKAETIALAHTVALSAKNLLTDEEKLVPIGSMAIITALGIKIMAGTATAGVIAAETAGAGATEATATGTGAAAGTAETGTATGMSTATKVAIGAGALAAAGGVAAVAAGSGDGTTDSGDGTTTDSTDGDPIESVVESISVICVRFPANDDYWIEAYIIDPQAIVASATISGSYGTSSLTYNLSPGHPGWWWTDPNIFISQGTEPDFPLDFTVYITFKDGTRRDVSRSVTTWEWAE